MEPLDLQVIMREHGDYLVRLAFVYVKSWSEAEEIVQDVFVKFYTTAKQFEGRASLKTYLAKMTINKSCDHLRSVKHKLKVLQNQMSNRYLNEQSVETITIKKFEQNEIAAKVFKLPLKYREVIVLYYYNDCSIAEIAMLLEIPVSTVKTRLKRAKEKLKIVLQPLYGEVSLDE